MKVWVLNCKHAKDRRDRISKALDKEGVYYTIHEALYWRDKDFLDVSDMVKDMEKGKHPYQITPSDLKWCNTLYRKYWKLSL